MVVILKFDNETEKYFAKLFNELNIECRISLKETDIAKAGHIILPDTNYLPEVIKKIQLMNLYSIIKILKVPVLGINNGMILMCNKIKNIHKAGFGFYTLQPNTITHKTEQLVKAKIENTKKDILLTGIKEKEIRIYSKEYLPANRYSTSLLNVKDKKYSFSMKDGNHFAIQIDMERNKNLFKQIISNFVEL